jgi:hypothetical protein
MEGLGKLSKQARRVQVYAGGVDQVEPRCDGRSLRRRCRLRSDRAVTDEEIAAWTELGVGRHCGSGPARASRVYAPARLSMRRAMSGECGEALPLA